MKDSNIKKINTAGLIGYILSIFLIIGTITAMVCILFFTAMAISISADDVHFQLDGNIRISSVGNFLGKLNSFISFDDIEDLSTLTDEANNPALLEDTNLSEFHIAEEDGGLLISAKTTNISFSLNRLIVAFIAAFLFLLAVTIVLYMMKALMKSLKTCETPFSEDIIKHMTRFAISLVCTIIISIFLGGFGPSFVFSSNYQLSINIENILFVAIIYILIIVFKYGAKLQTESDETL